MKNNPNKIPTTSQNLENEHLAKLKQVFPQFIKEGKIDFDALQEFFEKKDILAGAEKYGLSWAGKSNAFKAIRTPSTGTLTPQPEESKNWNETQNLFIEGDNLEVLKLLQKHYWEKVKMIYIDPPYNTGKDFIYKDNFTQSIADYYEQTGQTNGGIKMTANTEKNGRYHSDWLTMMYPRLFLAKNLLREDGVIFVSIDDNEVANLRLLMDEIFGEENVDSFVWKKGGDDRYGKMKNTETFRKDHEYIIVAWKNLNALNKLIEKPNFQKGYNNVDNDPRGAWLSGSISRAEYASNPESSNYYEVTSPTGFKVSRQFDVSREEFTRLDQERRIYWGAKGNSVPRIKVFVNEKREITPYSVLNNQGSTYSGKVELRSIFDLPPNKDIFDNPKPSSLIKTLVQLGTPISDQAIVLDFFAGSGTTAHAVMDLNSEDGGNRQWICVQLPEQTNEKSEAFKAGYKTISEITKERIRRAGEKIGKGDVGFKSYKLSPSNYRQWRELTGSDDEVAIVEQSKLFTENPLVEGYDEKAVVYEILLKEGFDLNSRVEQVGDGLKLYNIVDGDGEKRLLVTFAKTVSMEQVKNFSLGDHGTFVCLDSALDDTTKINISREVNLKVI